MEVDIMNDSVFYFSVSRTLVILSIIYFGLIPSPSQAEDGAGSCYNTDKSICILYQSGFTLTEAQASCPVEAGGFFSASSCPLNSIVGRCVNVYQGKIIVGYFYKTEWSTSTAEVKCIKTQGNFSAQ